MSRLAPLLVLAVAALAAACGDAPVAPAAAPSPAGHELPQFATQVNTGALAELRRLGEIRFLGRDDLAARGTAPITMAQAKARAAGRANGPSLAEAVPEEPCLQSHTDPCCPLQTHTDPCIEDPPPDYSYGSYAAPVSYAPDGFRETTLTSWSDGGTWSQYVFVWGYFSAGGGCGGSTSTYSAWGAGSYVGGSGQVWDYPRWNTSGSMTWAVSGTHEFGRSDYAEHVYYSYASVCG